MSTDEYSDEVLEETPARVAKFLSGIGAVPTIRTILAKAGMTDDDISEGRSLLLDCLAAPRGAAATTDTEDAAKQRAAGAELDAWDEPNFARYGACLRRRFPDQAAYVFNGLRASVGAAAVGAIATFLARVDALDHGSDKERAKSKKDDKKAVQLLADRGLTTDVRAHLKQLVDTALGPTAALPDATSAGDEARAARREKLVALKAWYEEWSTVAHAELKKRVHLIRVGLAKRKVRSVAEPAPAPAPVPAPAAGSGAATAGNGSFGPVIA